MNWYNIRLNSPERCCGSFWYVAYKILSQRKERGKRRLFTITIAIPTIVNSISPHLPVLNTQPFPLAITQALSKPFGSTYIASSPLLRFSSTNSDNPAAAPARANEALAAKRSIIHWGMNLRGEVIMEEVGMRPLRRRVRYRCKLCFPQNKAGYTPTKWKKGKKKGPTTHIGKL